MNAGLRGRTPASRQHGHPQPHQPSPLSRQLSNPSSNSRTSSKSPGHGTHTIGEERPAGSADMGIDQSSSTVQGMALSAKGHSGAKGSTALTEQSLAFMRGETLQHVRSLVPSPSIRRRSLDLRMAHFSQDLSTTWEACVQDWYAQVEECHRAIKDLTDEAERSKLITAYSHDLQMRHDRMWESVLEQHGHSAGRQSRGTIWEDVNHLS
jgi:hypothetical protein